MPEDIPQRVWAQLAEIHEMGEGLTTDAAREMLESFLSGFLEGVAVCLGDEEAAKLTGAVL